MVSTCVCAVFTTAHLKVLGNYFVSESLQFSLVYILKFLNIQRITKDCKLNAHWERVVKQEGVRNMNHENMIC